MSESILVLLAGVAILWAIWSDRGMIKKNWAAPATFWKRDEFVESKGPSQPLSVVVGIPLGLAAVTYGLVTLIN